LIEDRITCTAGIMAAQVMFVYSRFLAKFRYLIEILFATLNMRIKFASLLLVNVNYEI